MVGKNCASLHVIVLFQLSYIIIHNYSRNTIIFGEQIILPAMHIQKDTNAETEWVPESTARHIQADIFCW